MDVAASTAKVTDSAGKSSDCAKVFVGTSVFVNDSGWYLPPRFVVKGYTGGTVAKSDTQLLHVECADVTQAAGDRLAINYSYITGPFKYYVPSQKFNGALSLDLDKVVTDSKYPVAEKVASLVVNKSDTVIDAINKCTVQLTAAKRTDTGCEFDWQSTNPSQYRAYVHIGNPSVIGADGVMYGFFERSSSGVGPDYSCRGQGDVEYDGAGAEGCDRLLDSLARGVATAEVLRGPRARHHPQVAFVPSVVNGRLGVVLRECREARHKGLGFGRLRGRQPIEHRGWCGDRLTVLAGQTVGELMS